MPTASTNTRGQYPVAVRVAHVLEDRIANGEYEAGAWLPTERALADEFNVDRSQIRAALERLEGKALIIRAPGRRPVVSDRRRIATGGEKASETRQTLTIAAILPQHPVYPASAAILKGIQQALRHSPERCRLLFFDTHSATGVSTVTLERQALAALEDEDIAGGIFWPAIGAENNIARVREVQASGHPVVYVDRFPEGEPCDFVGVDNRLSASEAVEYLLRLGHTRIGHLTNTDPASSVPARAEGYREALAQAGIPYDPALVCTVPQGMELDGAAAYEHFFSLPQPPTAVFAMNDSLAHALIQTMEARGLRVPDDLSIIGFDDLERFSPRAALLTTMHQPFQRIGQRAAELLLSRLQEKRSGKTADGPPAARHLLLPTPLVERGTCAPPRTS
jgi:DNA-binding LacI/PurR family transcriptional regulator